MKCVVKVFLHRNTIYIYEQCKDDEYLYTAYLITGKKKYFLDYFESLTEAFSFSMQYCINN